MTQKRAAVAFYGKELAELSNQRRRRVQAERIPLARYSLTCWRCCSGVNLQATGFSGLGRGSWASPLVEASVLGVEGDFKSRQHQRSVSDFSIGQVAVGAGLVA